MSSANVGWLFYKEMYSNLATKTTKPDTLDNSHIKKINQKILDTKYHTYTYPKGTQHGITLKTVYPGLLIGTGYNHNAINCADNFDFGFFFDYTTGMPVIPGSSVKGVLRSLFKLLDDTLKKESVLCMFTDMFSSIGIETVPSYAWLKDLENEIFVGINSHTKEPKSMYSSDRFLDAYIGKKEKDKTIFADDFITPHGENLLIEPVPNRMLKIKPEVEFVFSFDLFPSTIDGITITAEQKEELFMLLLQFNGVGAKTNVGYGQFEEMSIEKFRKNKNTNLANASDGFDGLLLKIDLCVRVDNNMAQLVKYFQGNIDDKEKLIVLINSKMTEETNKFYRRIIKRIDELCTPNP